MRLILARHGETDANREGRVQGVGDSPLNSTGRCQAMALGHYLKDYTIDAVYSSPLTRALETAEPIARSHDLEVALVEGLRELDVGDLDGLTGPEIREKYPGFMEEWMRNVHSLRMPEGESIVELQARAWTSVEQIAQRHPEGIVVAVSHNFVIQSIVCKVLDLELNSFRKIRQDLGAVSILELSNEGSVLVTLNDRCHLRESS